MATPPNHNEQRGDLPGAEVTDHEPAGGAITRQPIALAVPPSLVTAERDLAYVASPEAMRPGHRLTVLIDGADAFPAMLEAITRAQHTVHLETYIIADDIVGDRFAQHLAERARAGVTVRLLYDGLGSLGLPEHFTVALQRAGVELACYQPLRWRNRHRWARRDHRKILVVDSTIGFLGGINLSREYAPRSAGGDGWHDTHLRVEGPAVAALETMFRDTWNLAGGAPFAPMAREALESVAGPETQQAMILGSDHRGRRSMIRRHYLHAINHAKTRVDIANAYFLPDPGISRALRRAARRGVEVNVMVPAESDITLVQLASEHTYGRLLRADIAIYLWEEGHLHAKTVCIDDVFCAVGSYNLDNMSLFNNLEVVLITVGDTLGSTMRALFDADRTRCCRLTPRDHRQRPLWRRLLSRLVYRFRRWL